MFHCWEYGVVWERMNCTENESRREPAELGVMLYYSSPPGSKTLITHWPCPLWGHRAAMSSLALTATVYSSPRRFSPEEKKIHMSPAIYGLLHTRYHTWISYHVGVSGALSRFDKAPVFVCPCMSTHGGPGGGRALFMHEVVVSQVIADFLLPWCVTAA